jgi:hypothetical protein
MNSIKPIQTRYKGCHFRSRLEARWAVFFDAVGLKWEYEAEGYDLGDGVLYLPDFKIPSIDKVIEIKPAGQKGIFCPTDTYKFSIYNDPSRDGDRPTGVMLIGTPGMSDVMGNDSDWSYQGHLCWDDGWLWCECPACGCVDIQFNGRSARNANHTKSCTLHTLPGHYDKHYNTNTPKLRKAFEAARSARFEHGETPK